MALVCWQLPMGCGLVDFHFFGFSGLDTVL